MTIIWTDKPSPYDTRISRIWFEKTGIRYTIDLDTHIYTAKLKDVQIILNDEAYRTTGRGR